jgi:hypothetical protein
MKNLIVLLALAASMIACETHGVIESEFNGQDGSHLRLQQYKDQGRFFYSLSAHRPATTHACEIELKVVAMGAGGKMKVQVERSPNKSCEST